MDDWTEAVWGGGRGAVMNKFRKRNAHTVGTLSYGWMGVYGKRVDNELPLKERWLRRAGRASGRGGLRSLPTISKAETEIGGLPRRATSATNQTITSSSAPRH